MPAIDRHPSSAPKPTKVVLWGLGAREYASLEITLAKLSSGKFVPCTDNAPDIAIVDLDGGVRNTIWNAFRARFPDTPALVLSARPVDIAGSIFLGKPFQVQGLLDAMHRLVRHGRDAHAPTPNAAAHTRHAARHAGGTAHDANPLRSPAAPAAPIKRPGPATPSASTPGARVTEPARVLAVTGKSARTDIDARQVSAVFDLESVQQYCGEAPDLSASAWSTDAAKAYFFDPDGYFLGKLQRAVAECRHKKNAILVDGPGAPFQLFSGKTMRIVNPYRDNVLRSLAIMPVRPETHRDFRVPENPGVAPHNADSAEQLIWKVALWTAHGRLPAGVNPSRAVTMTRWPNFTRLALTPHAMRIAAEWVNAPASPLELASRLAVPQRNVFSLFTAAWSIGLIKTSALPAQPKPAAPVVRHGLLARLLSHLGVE
jgi:hypothetical protein